MTEINKDFYCSAGFYKDGLCEKSLPCEHCVAYHRKHPTPLEFEQEFGFKYPDDGAVYIKRDTGWDVSTLDGLGVRLHLKMGTVICACTPFSAPPKDWRPE